LFYERRSTTDNLFIFRSILEKNYELHLDLHLLLTDCKQVYDSIHITHLYETLKEFGIPKKLVNLIKMTLQDSKGQVKIYGQMTEVFGPETGLR